MRKHRVTSFTRLVLFLFIFIPIAWVGINMYKGKDPLIEFKNLIGQSDNSKTSYSKTSEELTIEMQRTEIENLKKELELCKESMN